MATATEATFNNLEGHSVTYFDMAPYTLTFGGFNGTSYPQISHIFHGNLVSSLFPNSPPRMAHHQATYTRLQDTLYLTGGNAGSQTFSTIYLINRDNAVLVNAGVLQTSPSHHVTITSRNGYLLITGGAGRVNRGQPEKPSSSVEWYDIALQNSTEIAPLKTVRYGHQAVHLADSTVFVCEGQGIGGKILSDCEFFAY